ncbi:Uma2 family endonuclease [Paenibacillus cymbidii]|uniref:Uma2 family endonuclease n=1 Tax=Paenibacillus cymbidii TaxID=1639034 RepID=UPI00108082A8|nr:Uma2 family endonuclease [Paenibacillus cymbidii]
MSDGKPKQPDGKWKIKEQPGYYEAEERFEIIGGVRYDFLASPMYVHQKLLTNLYLAFHHACCADGETLLAPLDVHFDADNILQPDVIYIARENLGIIRDGYIYGAPDLVVEILSASTGSRDKTIKKDCYEKFGVREYWLADPVYRTIDQFVLENDRYMLVATLTERNSIAAHSIPCLSFALEGMFPDADKM